MHPTICVTEDGPYRVEGPVAICGIDGEQLREGEISFLCRCGGSRSKPFCDATHGLKAFDGTETADFDSASQRSDTYQADSLTVYDDRSRCAHFGQCTDRLAAVFRAGDEPFVAPGNASAAEISEVIRGCPSGALSFASLADPTPVQHAASITPIADGPYRVRGPVQLIAANGDRYELRERQTLCRCGQSGNKPFCDGSHWYAGFRDPQPLSERAEPPSLYEWAGGMSALQRLTERFYEEILSDPDPVLEPLFRHMDPRHPEHVAVWLAETFGGPSVYTEEHGGYEHMLSQHRGLALTEEQRSNWIGRMLRAADSVALPDDPDFRSTFVAYLEWGTRIASLNSAVDAHPIAHAPLPRWSWGQTLPHVPQPWDHPLAARRGRRRRG